MYCRLKKGIGIFLAAALCLCFVACGNNNEGEKNIEKDGVKQEETAKVKDEEKSSEETENESVESEPAVKDEIDTEKSIEEPNDEPVKAENVKEEVPKSESDSETKDSEKIDGADGNAVSETPAETPPAQTGSAEDEKKVADMVDMLNAVAGSMISEEMKNDGTVQFRAEGTRVVMVLTMTGYSAEQIQTKKEKFEQSWAEMTDSYGIVSMIKDTEPAVTSVSLEVYGNDGNPAFSKVL